MECSVRLENLRFYAYHGVMEQERRVGNEFEVTLEVYYPFENALKSDELEDTLNYAALYAIVEREMAEPSKLLERVVGRIIEAINKEFPAVSGGNIKISKLHPPFKCDMPNGAAAIMVKW